MSFINQYGYNISFSQEFVENDTSYIYFLSSKTRVLDQIYITKTDTSGNVIWSKEISHSDVSSGETDLMMVQTGNIPNRTEINIDNDESIADLPPAQEIDVEAQYFYGQYVIIAKSSNNPTLNIFAIDANGNITWTRAYSQLQEGYHLQNIVADLSGFFVLTSHPNQSNSNVIHTITRFDSDGLLREIVSLENIIEANDIVLRDQSLFIAGNFENQAAIIQLYKWDFSVQNTMLLSGTESLVNIWQIERNDYDQAALKVETRNGIFGIALLTLPTDPDSAAIPPQPSYTYIRVGDDFSALCVSSEYIYFTRDSYIYKIDFSLNSVWKKEIVADVGVVSFNNLSYFPYSDQLTGSSSTQSIIVDGSNGLVLYMDQEANTCLTLIQPTEIFQRYTFTLQNYFTNEPEELRSGSIIITYTIVDIQIIKQGLCDSTGVDENGVIQSSCLYLQAAGSTGTDSSSGIHLRWILKGAIAEHLPKGNHYSDLPIGFNRVDDFVQILRAPYIPIVTNLNFSIPPNTVIDSTGTWLYQVNDKKFYVYFRNITKYNQIRTIVNPLLNPLNFIQQYNNNIIEVEIKDNLFFASRLYVSGITESGNVKTEILSVETNQINLPKHNSFRRKIEINELSQKIFSENGRSIRFVASEIYVASIDFEFYNDFIKSANSGASWKDLGKYSLSLDDNEVTNWLDPDPDNHPIHAVWPRYNGGEFVNTENYKTKWNGNLSDVRNRIKHSVQKYIDFSNDPQNPLANEIYYLENENGEIIDYENSLEISHLTILQMASLDYHVARMLGLGCLDFSSEVYNNQQYIYAAQYATEGDIGDGNGERLLKHISLSLPTSLNNKRETLPVELLNPLPGIITSDTNTENNVYITDENGYTHDGEARYLSLFTKELTPDEPENSPFYFSDQSFDMSKFTYPVYVGIEYKKSGESNWRIPELPNDTEYQNVNSQGNLSGNETIAIAIPEYGQPAFIHRETKSGLHLYASYGVNWFSRAKSSMTSWEVNTTIIATNRLLPPSNINSILIQKESPLMFTSENEQQILSTLTGDKTYVRLTYDYDTAQDMISYLKMVNGKMVSDFSPLPDNEEIFADEVELFFRPEIPKQVFGMIQSISDLPGNPLVSVIQSANLPLYSTGDPNNQGSSQILSPVIPVGEIQNYIGGIFTAGTDEFVIQNIFPGSDPSLPVFHILKKQVASAFEQNGNIPFDPADFIAPIVKQSFMVVENMQNDTTWGNVNPHPLKIKIGSSDWSIHTEEIKSYAGQEPDISINVYYRKFRGINRNAEIKKFIDPNVGSFQGIYEITFPGFILNNHPQDNPAIGQSTVKWYRGSVRIARENKVDEERKILKVLRIDDNPLSSRYLVIYVHDETFETDPILLGDQTITTVNFYPGYRVYLYKNDPFRLNETNIYSQNENVLEKYSIFGLRSVDNGENYKSLISTPTPMFSRKILEPQAPQTPIGAKYATRPDYFGRSTYAFTTEFNHKPFSVTFVRSNDDILLSSLYKQTKYGDEIEKDSVQEIRLRNNDEFINDRLLDLANVTIDPATHLFKEYNGYHLPLPNSPQLFENINIFIQEHNQFYGEFLPMVLPQNVSNMQYVIIQGHTSNKHGAYDTLTFGDFVKQTIQNTYVPLTEIPIIYQHIKNGDYQPIAKAQVIRDRNGTLLSPTSPEFDMAPMAKLIGSNPHKTLFVDFTLDGNSKSVYFYAVKESNSQMEQSDLSPAIGPVRLVNSYPLKTPEIKSAIPVFENPVLNITPKMEIKINSYDSIYNVKKLKLYRALNMGNAMSVRTMILVKDIDLENEGIINDEIWTILDDFGDLAEVPFGDPLYYRVTVEAEIEYAEAQYNGQTPVIVTDYAPSEVSKLMVTTITENVLPTSPELSFTGNENPAEITDVVFRWGKKAYKGNYHLYKMNNQGNWTKIASIHSNNVLLTLALNDTEWGNGGILPLIDDVGNTIFHHFKVLTENTSGMFSIEENRLTIGNQFAFSVESTPQLARYKPYFTTDGLTKNHNLYLPPNSIYGNLHNTQNGVVTDVEILNAWKSMPGEYIILPEILQDHQKNPLVYNIRTKKFGCYYSVTRMWDGHVQGSMANFLRNSVVRTRTSGARECIVNLGSDVVFIKNNIEKLQFALASGNNKGMDTITLIINGVYSHYTLEQILNM